MPSAEKYVERWMRVARRKPGEVATAWGPWHHIPRAENRCSGKAVCGVHLYTAWPQNEDRSESRPMVGRLCRKCLACVTSPAKPATERTEP